MPRPTWIVEPLSSGHDREGFSCGNSAPDRYLKEQANQDLRSGCAVPFVLIPNSGESAVVGYYTLSSFGIDAGVVPPEIAKKLPRYPLIPATLLGRLAVDEMHHGEGIGEFLFMDALHRSRAQSGQIAAVAVVVEALEERAERFYQHFGFIPFSTNHRPFIHYDEDRETAICVTSILGSGAAEKTAEPSGIRCAGP
jgi:GNAT superfamily N-acetyltransferase